MRISLNLATRPFADLGPAMKRLRIAMGVLAVAAIGLALGVHALRPEGRSKRGHASTRWTGRLHASTRNGRATRR